VWKQRQRSESSPLTLVTLSAPEQVRVGAEFVDESGRTIAEIMDSVKKVTDIVAEIAAASSGDRKRIKIQTAADASESISGEGFEQQRSAGTASQARGGSSEWPGLSELR